jgi:uncharacterized protein (TIGR03067 family)
MTPLLVIALAVAAPAPKDPPKKDPPGPIGRWALERATFAGMALPAMDLTVTFTADGRYETKVAGGEAQVSGTFSADPKKQPAEIDVTEPAGGQVSASIYRIDGDTLTICTTTGGERPKTFDAPAGSKFVLLVLKRIKD